MSIEENESFSFYASMFRDKLNPNILLCIKQINFCFKKAEIYLEHNILM